MHGALRLKVHCTWLYSLHRSPLAGEFSLTLIVSLRSPARCNAIEYFKFKTLDILSLLTRRRAIIHSWGSDTNRSLSVRPV
jgi:hypothetical protein